MTHLDMTGETREFGWPLLDRQDETFTLAHRWQVPADIRVAGDELCFGEFGALPEKWEAPGAKLMTDFLALADAPPHAIERFARRWGVLGFCQHNADRYTPLVFGHEYRPSLDLANEPCRILHAEPLEAWRWHARRFRYLLDQAASLRKRRTLRPRSKRAHDEVREFLRRCGWVVRYFGCLRPVLVVEDGKFAVKLGGRQGLPAALTSQLLFTLAGALGIGTCASCGKLFPLSRRARKGKNSYCPNCGIRAAWRDAQQRRREKAKKADKQR
jgi:predicted RNA-binding Zn-ribbon protein involved in translation (DUF1610 family)